jgi:hypothetical protein
MFHDPNVLLTYTIEKSYILLKKGLKSIKKYSDFEVWLYLYGSEIYLPSFFYIYSESF